MVHAQPFAPLVHCNSVSAGGWLVQVGVPPGRSLGELSAEQKELLSEAYSADPAWSSKVCTALHGALLVSHPRAAQSQQKR